MNQEDDTAHGGAIFWTIAKGSSIMKNTKKIKVAMQKTVVVSKPATKYTFFSTHEEAIEWLKANIERRLRENPEFIREMRVPEHEPYRQVTDSKWWIRCAN